MESKLVKELVKTIKRLSVNNNRLWYEYGGFRKLSRKIESKNASRFSIKEKIGLSEYLTDYKYYQGKIMAYMFVLNQLVGQKKAQELLFKGIEGNKKYDKYGKRK